MPVIAKPLSYEQFAGLNMNLRKRDGLWVIVTNLEGDSVSATGVTPAMAMIALAIKFEELVWAHANTS